MKHLIPPSRFERWPGVFKVLASFTIVSRAVISVLVLAGLILPGCGGETPEGDRTAGHRTAPDRAAGDHPADALSIPNQQRKRELETYMQSALEVYDFSGAVLVARGDEVLLRAGYGFADRDAREINRPETRFLIGSATKIFTALAIMQLVEAGQVDLGDPLSKYLPDYPPEVAGRVTVHHLLTHTSGIRDVLTVPAFREQLAAAITPDEMTELFAHEPLSFEPGTRHAYSNSNYALLARIIEIASGLSWAEYLDTHICDPIAMRHTGVPAEDASGLAQGYLHHPRGLIPVPVFHISRGYGAGDIASTVGDLYRLDRALARGDLVTQSTLQQMLTPQAENYGYGWMIETMGSHTLTFHGGGVPGQVSIIQRWIDDSVFVVVLANNAGIPVHTIATGLAAAVLGETYELPRIKHPATLTHAQLAEYEGRYRLAGGMLRRIELRDTGLVAIRSEDRPYVILSEGKDRFYFAHDPMTTLRFLRDRNGEITAHVLQRAFESDTAYVDAVHSGAIAD